MGVIVRGRRLQTKLSSRLSRPAVEPERSAMEGPAVFSNVLWFVWQSEGGVLVKKVDRANQEIVPECRHDRPVFQADNVVEAQCVPTDNICVLNGTIRLGPFGQPTKALVIGDISAGGIAFVRAVRRNPHLV